MEVVEQTPFQFVIPRHGRMRVPGVVYATRVPGASPTGKRWPLVSRSWTRAPRGAGPRPGRVQA